MNKIIVSVLCLLGSFPAGFSIAAHAASFKVVSATLKPGSKIGMDQVFNGFGCTGKNISPELKWEGAPQGTRTFAVTVYDPDAPTGSGWWHWLVFNIPATTTELPLNASAGSLPQGAVQSRTDFGKPGYGGPCPPPGDKPHRYIFTVYALKDQLSLDPDSPAAMVGFYIHQNKLASATFTAKFGR